MFNSVFFLRRAPNFRADCTLSPLQIESTFSVQETGGCNYTTLNNRSRVVLSTKKLSKSNHG
jgi:hypothetical protein